ncbi:MAG: dipeptide epimerase [Pseudomonadota bacterium]
MKLTVRAEQFKLYEPFTIAGFAWQTADVCTVELEVDGVIGRGEGAPIFYHGDDAEKVAGQIEQCRSDIEKGITREQASDLLPPGAALCALDCALWDLEAHKEKSSVHELSGLAPPTELDSAITITLNTVDEMAKRSRRFADYPLLKVKLGGTEDEDAIKAVREAAPKARITVDANTAWSMETLERMEPVLFDLNVELIEQPMPPDRDDELSDFRSRIPIAADESCQTEADVQKLIGKYQTGVIKLDKAGGLTGAIALMKALQDAEMELMVSCMIGTSLGMAPARLIGTYCKTVDLDAPMNAEEDRNPAIRYEKGRMGQTPPELWGGTDS